MLFPLVKVRRAQILVWLPPRQHHIDDGEESMADRNQGAFLPPAGGNPFVLGGEIRVVRFGGDMGNFDEDLPQPATPFARLPTQAFPPALVVPRTHTSPGGEVLGTWEATPVGPDLRNQDLRRPLSDTRDGIQEGNGLLVRGQTLVNFPTDALNGLVQVLQRAQVLRQQEAMMRCHTPL